MDYKEKLYSRDYNYLKIDDIDKDLLQIRKYRMRKCLKIYPHYWVALFVNKVVNKQSSIYLHREIMKRILDRELNKNESVDHINGDRSDNRRENLRICNDSQNVASQKVTRSSNGYRGVTYRPDKRLKWQCKYQFKQKYVHVGYYKSKEEAAMAYNISSKLLWKEFAFQNDVNIQLDEEQINKIQQLVNTRSLNLNE